MPGFLQIRSAIAQGYQDEPQINEFIFEVLLLPDWRISEAIFAYQMQGSYYLPIQALTDGFEFFVTADVSEYYAKGYASREENSFIIDGKRNELIVRGERRELSPDDILRYEKVATDDLYVRLEVLNEIWPVDMRVNLSNLTIFAEAEEELSFQRERERRERQTKLMERQKRQKARRERLPRRKHSYQLLGKPAVDIQHIYDYETKEDDLTGSNIITGTQQIGRTIAEYSANMRFQDDKLERPENIRLRFTRQAREGRELFLGIKRVAFGDVNLNQRDLISNTQTGRGVEISNTRRDRSNEFDRVTIEGTGPPGWEVELYNNDELIAIGEVEEDGEYFFEDVLLTFGNNQIKILLFGPQGQVREENRSFQAGGNMLEKGKFEYNLGLADSDRKFILLDNDPRTEPRGVTQNARAAYGVNRRLTLFGSYTRIPDQNRDRQYMTGGASFSTPFGLLETELYNELSGGHATNVELVTRFLGFRTNASVALYNDFESDLAGEGPTKKTFESELVMNDQVRIFDIPFGLRFRALHTEREEVAKTTDFNASQTFTRGGIRLTHNVFTRLIDSHHERTTGSFSTTVRERPWQLRGAINYELHPFTELSSANAELRYREDGMQAALIGSHNFENSVYRIGVQGGYDFGTLLGTLQTDYERDGGWTFTVRATTSLHPYTEDGDYTMSSNSMRNAAPIRARVFLDKDNDGDFTSDVDEPLEDAGLLIEGGKSRSQTNENGYLVTSASHDRLVNIQLDESSLVDPYYMSARKGFSTTPLKGSMIDTQFPVLETGVIEGTVYRNTNNRSVAGLLLNLVNEEGEIISEVETAFDGYYVFEFVPPGQYSIQTDETHKVKLLGNSFKIAPDNLYLYGQDLYLKDKF